MPYLDAVSQFVQAHYVALGYVGIAGVSALNPPGKPDGGFYGWFYRFAMGLLPIAKHELPIKTEVKAS
jgi:hypothetical protein